MGGHIEYLTSRDVGPYARISLLDGDPKSVWMPGNVFPADVVLSFLAHDTALVSGVTLSLPPSGPMPIYDKPNEPAWAKDVEIWTSMDSPTTGFRKVASTTLPQQTGDHFVPLSAPVEARYVKISITSNYGSPATSMLSDVAVREGSAPDYVPFLKRHADLAALLTTGAYPAAGGPSSVAIAPPATPATAVDDCLAPKPAGRPSHTESHNVLVVVGEAENYAAFNYLRNAPASPKIRYFPADPGDGFVDSSIFTRVNYWNVTPEAAAPGMLVPSSGIDTVVLEQLCNIKTSVSEGFKRALVSWVGAGHKLIIQDADGCGPFNVPDYSFLPFPFATSNPGAQGAASALRIVEKNSIASPESDDPAFLDLEAWRTKTNGNPQNDFGDSNTVIKYDPNWCGAIVGTNVKGANGFVLAYAHYGNGLILYDGVDRDQLVDIAYRQYAARELLQPFAPDGLPCSTRLSPFVVTTDPPLVNRSVLPGQTYTYPLSVLAVQPGYKGTVRLSLATTRAMSGITTRIEPETVSLGTEAKATLTVTMPAQLPEPWHMAVRGDASDVNAILCLAAREQKTGRLTVTADLGSQPASPSRKNLLIVLDLSGSMNLPLGKSTRIGTARQVLHDVLGRIPDDFNVGLRLYGHRFGSRQKETCTDSELTVPVSRLDRAAILKIIDSTKPRGETPLVYSVRQAIGDLKAAGGGSVALITDGEESCGGDFAAASEAIRQSGLDFRLNIVGFTLKDQRTRQQLGSFASTTGGSYYTAQDGPALSHALVAATISRFPYSVIDAAGVVVANGEAGDRGQELPAGTYRVVVQAGDDRLTLDGVGIAVAGNSGVKVTKKGDSFALER